MNETNRNMVFADRHGASLAERLRGAGVVWIETDDTGSSLRSYIDHPKDWLVHLIVRSRVFRAALKRAATQWSAQRATGGAFGMLSEPLSGLVLIPLRSHSSDAGARAYGVAVLVLDEALTSGTLRMLCEGAELDSTFIASHLAAEGMPTRREVVRLHAFVRALAACDAERVDGNACGEQLSTAWEELHLLHSLIGGLEMSSGPRGVLTKACEELGATLQSGWTGAWIADARGGEGTAVVSGSISPNALRAYVARLGKSSAGIFGPDARANASRGTVAAAPIFQRGRCIGWIATGDRKVGDREMSSVELKLVVSVAGHAAIFLENARLFADLDDAFVGTLAALVNAIDAKDPYTRGHSQRVAALARDLAIKHGASAEEARLVHVAGLVHDIGKIGVSEAILLKPGKLTPEERAAINEHPEIGYRILKDVPQLAGVLGGVRHHHERWDGTGYGHGLARTDIPMSARMIALADTFDAMCSSRTYRKGRPISETLLEMGKQGGTQFDPVLLREFLTLDLTGYREMLAAGVKDTMAGDADSSQETRRAA